MDDGLELRAGRWFGMTMWPGYLDQPYRSPIRVRAHAGMPAAGDTIDLDFFNLRYTAGVANMCWPMSILAMEDSCLLARRTDARRLIAIEPLTAHWMEHHLPDLYRPDQFDGKLPVTDALMELAPSY